MDVAERVVLGYVAAGTPVLPRDMAASFGASPAKGFVVGEAGHTKIISAHCSSVAAGRWITVCSGQPKILSA